MMIRIALPAPRSRTSPYMPDKTYVFASPMVINTPRSFWVTYKRALSSLTLLSTSMSLDPAKSCMTSADVTMGVIPNSITVPWFDARITLIQ
ncbi:hypothetical protein KC19_3G271300 [Ceratodon purpureus]|uniref:Uncharacterized protein n=1 Tax=Ceratodon purpureus TaxID=3225 RepID=A0A8T0IPZ8_CERPU|nr:hypothetical protein KC19_6G226400 [Ceratodon purpureus]KAG0585262.1 hypothetical protein KC19_3G271300 [Ceratodon purpureus]